MDFRGAIYILVGSSFGLILRLFIKYKCERYKRFYFDHSSIVNVLSSLIVGIFVALKITSKDIFLLFLGFLGCFSTFSSFIYQLFNFIENKKYFRLFIYYIGVLVLSFLFFCIGNFITLIFKNWIEKNLY